MGNANGFLWIKAIMNITIHNCLVTTMSGTCNKIRMTKSRTSVVFKLNVRRSFNSFCLLKPQTANAYYRQIKLLITLGIIFIFINDLKKIAAL